MPTKPEDDETTRRAPNGAERTSALFRIRTDLLVWLDSQAAAASPKRSRNLQLEILLDELRLNAAKTGKGP